MRSSKQRSRSKQNRNRSVGNIVNRVFDSSGPEGKVRGTPQQIIEKYNQLARDAQLSGDRVATENFQQHSEHYTRMLAEATREQEARREAQEAQHRERQQQQSQQQQSQQHQRGPDRDDRGAGDQPDTARQPDIAAQPQHSGRSDVIDMDESGDAGLVETPESKPAPKPRSRRPRKPAADKASENAEAPASDGPAEAAE